MKNAAVALALVVGGCGPEGADPFVPIEAETCEPGVEHAAVSHAVNDPGVVGVVEVGAGTVALAGPGAVARSTTVLEHDGYVFVVNTDEGTLSRMDVDTSEVVEIDVGAEPSRVAVLGDSLVVTLRGERGLAVVTDPTGDIAVDRVVDVGAEPVGVVVAGGGVYVALSQANQVVELDAVELSVERRFPVADEPTWLAAGGANLYVGSAREGTFSWVDLHDGAVTGYRLPLAPPANTILFDGVPKEFEWLRLRITGDLAVAPDVSAVLIPTLHIDNMTSVSLGPDGQDGGGYGGGAFSVPGSGRFTGALTEVPLDAGGAPLFAATVHYGVARPFDAFTAEIPDEEVVHGLVGTAAWGDDGERLATMPGNSAVAILGRDALCDLVSDGCDGIDGPAFRLNPAVFAYVPAGPVGLALSADGVWVHGFIRGEVAFLDGGGIEAALDEAVAKTAVIDGELQDMTGESVDLAWLFGLSRAVSPASIAGVTSRSLPAGVAEGRALFNAADDPFMAGTGAGVSCATCHFQGRNDGLTWPLAVGPRQTPSLAGNVRDTAPVTWSDAVASVADEALLTSQERMGGSGLSMGQAEHIEAYVNWTRHVDHADKGAVTAQVRRGGEIFARADVGCASCHAGPTYSNPLSYGVVDNACANTPTLVGIAATAPYFHDGSAATLRDVLDASRGGGMGDTSMLTEAELDDLEAFLRSL